MRTRARATTRHPRTATRRPRATSVRLWPYLLLIAGLLAMLTVVSSWNGAGGGTLQPDGRRLLPHTRAHTAMVLQEPALRRAGVGSARVRAAYAAAAAHPKLMDDLYCWCGCIESGMRSALECFEGLHAARCDLCIRVALTAADLASRGERDPGTVQREVDRRSGRG